MLARESTMCRDRAAIDILRIAAFALMAFSWANAGTLRAEDFKTLRGHSETRRDTPGETYNFREKVDGEARVIIRNAAKVDFYAPPSGYFNDGSKIDGDARVLMEAQDLTFNGKIDG